MANRSTFRTDGYARYLRQRHAVYELAGTDGRVCPDCRSLMSFDKGSRQEGDIMLACHECSDCGSIWLAITKAGESGAQRLVAYKMLYRSDFGDISDFSPVRKIVEPEMRR